MSLSLFNSILIPLLGGFLFISLFRRTAPFVSRSDRARLFFYSALAGLALFVLTRALVLQLTQFEFIGPLVSYWKQLAPFDISGTSFGSLIVASATALVANLIDRKSKLEILQDHVGVHGNRLESFLLEASDRAHESPAALVMLSMEDRKVYVGWVNRTPRNPNDNDTYLKFLPLMSGFRDSEDLHVEFENFYDETISILAEQGAEDVDFEEFAKILPVSRIVSAGYFDPKAYIAFQGDPGTDD